MRKFTHRNQPPHTFRRHRTRTFLFVWILALIGFFVSRTIQGQILSQRTEQESNPRNEAKSTPPIPTTLVSISVEDLMLKIQSNPERLSPLPPDVLDSETIWLARCIFSETKRPEEMELIAWVVRNRVETEYRGKNSYESVVLDQYQFSAFNPTSRKKNYYAGLNPYETNQDWQTALTIAYGVVRADSSHRPFSIRTRHFYSERSLKTDLSPEWARGLVPVQPTRAFNLDFFRFRFFEGVS